MAKQNAMNKEGQMTKMNWNRAAKLYGRRTLDRRFENEIPDRAQRWLAKAENRRGSGASWRWRRYRVWPGGQADESQEPSR
jgi:hypothetical protein